MPLRACMREHTHREFRTWMAWLERQWNEPDRADHYRMQIAQEVCRVLAKNKASITLGKFKIPFGWVKKKEKEKEKSKSEMLEQKTSQAKSRWMGWLHMRRN